MSFSNIDNGQKNTMTKLEKQSELIQK